MPNHLSFFQQWTKPRRLHRTCTSGCAGARWLANARDILIEHSRSRDAEAEYRRLSAMSDRDLARRGIRRAEIATHLKREIYGDPSQ